MLVPLTRYARKPLATAVARPVSSLFSASKFSTVASARRPASVRAPALTGAASSAPGVSNGQMGGASMFPSKLFARALSTKEGEAKEEKKEEKKEEEPAAQSEGGEAKEEAKVETAEDKLAKAEEQIKTLEEEKKELKHKYLTALADVENMRQRMNHKAEEDKKFAVRSFAKNMLEVADCLEKALEAMPEEKRKADPNLQTVYEGVQMIDTVFLKGLQEASIKKFVPQGEKFDPNLHNAMFELPAAEGQEKGMVGHVVKSGYMIYDRVLRPAEVGVTKEVPK